MTRSSNGGQIRWTNLRGAGHHGSAGGALCRLAKRQCPAPRRPPPWYGCGYRVSAAIARPSACWDRLVRVKRKVEWGLPHRGRISFEEAAWVREHLDEVQALRSERGVPLLDPADPKTKERYGL
jgi:hypothetical protein